MNLKYIKFAVWVSFKPQIQILANNAKLIQETDGTNWGESWRDLNEKKNELDQKVNLNYKWRNTASVIKRISHKRKE